MQIIHIIGNLTKAPQLRQVNTSEGSVSVCDFDVAVNERGRNEAKQTTYFRVTAWRGLAETVAKYLTKGSKIYVSGHVSARAYTSSDGQARASLEIRADNVEFLSTKAETETAQRSAPQAAQEPVPDPGMMVVDDELPF